MAKHKAGEGKQVYVSSKTEIYITICMRTAAKSGILGHQAPITTSYFNSFVHILASSCGGHGSIPLLQLQLFILLLIITMKLKIRDGEMEVFTYRDLHS